jgi:hypothetical protein
VSEKHEHEERPEHEVRHRHSEQRRRHRAVVEAGVLAVRGEDAQWHADREREQQRPQPELERHREAGEDDVPHLLRRILVRRPEVEARGIAEEAHVLLAERPVEPVRMLELRLRGSGNLALGLERPAGRGAHEEEGEGRDRPQRGDHEEQPPQDERGQGRASRAAATTSPSPWSIQTWVSGWTSSIVE